MNYLAHAVAVLDDPWLVAGTSLPDWLRVVDKRARVRPAALRALELPRGSPQARLRDGALRHHDDDLRFHTLPVFGALSDEAVHAIRALSDDPRLRATTLGHIAVEMLLDACIEERRPGSIARYYDALDALDDAHLAACARAFTARPLEGFETLAVRFRRARFLESYGTDEGVVGALAGVCRRAGLASPPPGTAAVVGALRPRVRDAAGDLALLG